MISASSVASMSAVTSQSQISIIGTSINKSNMYRSTSRYGLQSKVKVSAESDPMGSIQLVKLLLKDPNNKATKDTEDDAT